MFELFWVFLKVVKEISGCLLRITPELKLYLTWHAMDIFAFESYVSVAKWIIKQNRFKKKIKI